MNDTVRPNDFAFPHAIKSPSGDILLNSGLTKREYLAALAMSGMCSNAHAFGNHEDLAKWAVADADALIAELNKEPDEKTKV